MHVFRTAGAATTGVAVLLLTLVQFLPWGGIEEGGLGFSVEANAHTWEAKLRASSGGQSERDSADWYDEDLKGEDGIGKLRVGAALLASSLGLIAIGAVLIAALRPPLGTAVTGAGALLGAAAVLVFALGVGDFFDGEQTWGPSFYLALIGTGLALVGAAVAAVPERWAPKAKAKPGQGPSY